MTIVPLISLSAFQFCGSHLTGVHQTPQITFLYSQLSQAGHSEENGLLVFDVLLLFGFLAVVPFVGVHSVYKLSSNPFPVESWIAGLD